MIRLIILASFFLLASQLLKIADQQGICISTPVEFAALACIALTAFIGLAKILSRKTEKGGTDHESPRSNEEYPAEY